MNGKTLIGILGVCLAVVLLAIAHLLLSAKVSNQQRQIDQLCSFVFEQARSQGALEEIGLHPNLKYDLIFADFSRGTALLNAKSLGYKNYGKGYPVIIGDVRSEVLQDWCNNPNNVQ